MPNCRKAVGPCFGELQRANSGSGDAAVRYFPHLLERFYDSLARPDETAAGTSRAQPQRLYVYGLWLAEKK